MAAHSSQLARSPRLLLAVRSLAAGPAHRAASTLLILIVGLVACAAASTGPAYYVSAQTSILRDTFANADVLQRGFEVASQDEVGGTIAPLADAVTAVVARTAADPATRKRLFAAPLLAIEASAVQAGEGAVPLAWRTDVCSHLRFEAGRCATARNEVVISPSLAAHTKWRVGQRLRFTGWPTLTVVGVYAIPDWSAPYWFDRGSIYFNTEDLSSNTANPPPPTPDAMFTARSTVDDPANQAQGTLVVDQFLNTAALRSSDLNRVVASVNAVTSDQGLAGRQATTQSLVPSVVSTIHASWRSLAVPVFLITIQLLVLVWLLMFLVVRDAIDARGPEIALMKLRGRRGLRLLSFALSEPVALLAIALPLGVLVGGLACVGLNSALLRPGTPTTVPALAWAAAAVASVGGLVATLVAGRRTLRRGVVDQWQHASREATHRGWVVDAIVVTAAIGGIAELIIGGHVTSVQSGSLGLLVPGLLGLAVAVLASRLLPAICAALFGITRRRGGLGAFLAVRHVARRTTGVRTTIILATAFALATFSIASWATSRSNRQLVANVGVGAATVLSVASPVGTNLGSVVAKIDPGGTKAALVDSYSSAGGPGLLAVDPTRFAHVAAWPHGFTDRPLAALMREIAPRVAPPIVLTGSQMRVRLDVEKLAPPSLQMYATIRVPGADGALNRQLGSLQVKRGRVTLTTDLPSACPCTLDNLSLSTPSSPSGLGYPISGAVTLNGIDVRTDSGWHPLPNLERESQWRAIGGDSQPDPSALAATGAALRWSFAFHSAQTVALQVADRPAVLPAVVARATASGTAPFQANGLDTNAVAVRPVAIAAALPGLPNGGLIVDRSFAERAAGGTLSQLVTQQVWVGDGAAPAVAAGLRRAGVRITQTQTASAQAKFFARQGPGLASTVFLADAVAAAVLGAAGAVMGLVSAGRRRRFEYAALGAAGASPRSLYAGLLLEQVAVLLFGAVAGVMAGVAAALVAVRSVPEFVIQPSAPPLSYALPAGVLAVYLLLTVAALFAVSALSSRVLLAGAGADQLREAPP